MSGVGKLGLVLLLVFAFSLLVLAAELLFLLSRRWRGARQSSGDDPELAYSAASGGGAGSHSRNAKEVLCLLCFKSQCRVEPAASPAAGSPALPAGTSPAVVEAKQAPPEAEECELTRWRAMCFGPSRVLYTIKEEEREEMETEGGRISGDGSEEAEAFSTPCSSPPFYTPSSSPPREAEAAGDHPGALSPARSRA